MNYRYVGGNEGDDDDSTLSDLSVHLKENGEFSDDDSSDSDSDDSYGSRSVSGMASNASTASSDALARRENESVFYSKVFVFIVILAASITCGGAAYLFLSEEERGDFVSGVSTLKLHCRHSCEDCFWSHILSSSKNMPTKSSRELRKTSKTSWLPWAL